MGGAIWHGGAAAPKAKAGGAAKVDGEKAKGGRGNAVCNWGSR